MFWMSKRFRQRSGKESYHEGLFCTFPVLFGRIIPLTNGYTMCILKSKIRISIVYTIGG